jgi:hypothetical protein
MTIISNKINLLCKSSFKKKEMEIKHNKVVCVK